MDVLGSPSLIVLMFSVDVKQHLKNKSVRTAQELCESWGGRPGPPVPNSPYGLYGCKATFEEETFGSELRSRVKVEVDVPNSP